MTVPSPTHSIQVVGLVAGTPIPFNYPLHDATEIEVLYGDELLATLNVHYTVTLFPLTDYATAEIVPLAALVTAAAGGAVILQRVLPLTQTLDIPANNRLPEKEIEKAYDRIVMMVQQITTRLARTLRASYFDPPLGRLPLVADRASRTLGFDIAGNPVAFSAAPGLGSVNTQLPVVAGHYAVFANASGEVLVDGGPTATFQSVVDVADAILTTTKTCIVNRDNPVNTALTLPDLAVWDMDGLRVLDYSINLVDHEIMLTPFVVAQKIMRLAQFPITSNPFQRAGVTLYKMIDPDNPANFVWIIAP